MKKLSSKIITAYVPVYNEENRIRKFLDYYSQFLEQIIVVDNFSRDKTFDIANSYKNTKCYRKKNNGATETNEWLV